MLTVEGRAEDVELANEPSVSDVVEPLQALGGVLSEAENLVTDELRSAFEDLDRLGQDLLRQTHLAAMDAEDANSRLFRRFATRAIATVGRFTLVVKRHAFELAAVGGSLAGMEAQWGTVTWLLSRVQPIWDALRPFVPFL